MNRTDYTGQEIRQKYSGTLELGQLFEKLELEFHNKGEVICQFWVNGMNLSESDENRLKQIQVLELETLQVDSEKPIDLLFGLLKNWVDELPILISASDQLAQSIRFDGIDGHYKSFVELVDSCQFLIDSLISLEKVIELDEEQQKLWNRHSEMTAQAIGVSLKALESKDFVNLSEVLEYDLGNSLQTWHDVLKSLEQKLKHEYETNRGKLDSQLFRKNADSSSAHSQ